MNRTIATLSLTGAALLTACTSSGTATWGHATIRTKTPPPPPPVVKKTALPTPSRVHTSAPAQQIPPAPRPIVVKPTAPPPPVAKPAPPAPREAAPGKPSPHPALGSQQRSGHIVLPQNNPKLREQDYPTMPGQNRGLRTYRRGY